MAEPVAQKTASLLIVDDDILFRRLVISVLEDSHRVFHQAALCSEADALLQNNQFDLMIVDGVLPDADGIDWIRGLRAAKVNVPIIFASTFQRDSQTFSEFVKDCQIVATLQKPVSSQALWTAVDKVLSGHQAVEDLGREVRIAKAMQTLTAQYLAQLPQRVDEMVSLAETYKEDPEDVDLNQRLRLLVHKMRGTAGTHGLQKLSEEAGVLEDMLREIRSTGAVPDMDFWRSADLAIARIKAMLG